MGDRRRPHTEARRRAGSRAARFVPAMPQTGFVTAMTPASFTSPGTADAARSVARRVAATRGGRAVYTGGEYFLATLHVLDHPMLGVPALDGPDDHPALVRLSKAALPGALPDVLGLAVRLPGAGGAGGDLDLLLTSTVWPGLLPFPRRGFAPATYSTVLPYDHAGEPLRFLAVTGDRARRVPADLRLLARAVTDRPLDFVLGVDGADRRPLARLSVHTPLDRDADEPDGFDPVLNSHPALRPSGWLQAVRVAAYAGSRQGRRAKGEVSPDVKSRWRSR